MNILDYVPTYKQLFSLNHKNIAIASANTLETPIDAALILFYYYRSSTNNQNKRARLKKLYSFIYNHHFPQRVCPSRHGFVIG